jgi:hypothetical protein
LKDFAYLFFEKVATMFPSISVCVDQLKQNAEEWKNIDVEPEIIVPSSCEVFEQREGDLNMILDIEISDTKTEITPQPTPSRGAPSKTLSIPIPSQRRRKSIFALKKQ